MSLFVASRTDACPVNGFAAAPSQVRTGHTGHTGHGGAGGPDARGTEADNSSATTAPDAAIDPVGGGAVPTASALTSIRAGKVYCFSSKENREQVEAAPKDFAKKAAGQPMQSGAADPRSHRGC
ncbi:MAG: hypothetical protein ABIQ87_14345 [Rubrivivax sp.]